MSEANGSQDPVAVKHAILKACTGLFGERDYPATSMRDIARAVGRLPGSLYAYVENKEQILFEIVESGIDQYVAAVEDLPEGPADFRLRAAIVQHVRLVAEDPLRALVVFHQWRYLTDDNRRRVVQARKRYETFFRSTIERGVDDGTFALGAPIQFHVFSILGALNWVPEWISPRDARAVERGERMADLLLRGLQVQLAA